MNHSNRRTFVRRIALYVSGLPFLSYWKKFIYPDVWGSEMVYFTNGIKIAELRPHSAIVWTRLCSYKNPVAVNHQRIRKGDTYVPVDFDEKMSIEDMDGAVQGAIGEVRMILDGAGSKSASEWYPAGPDDDFTVHIPAGSLQPSTNYRLTLEGRKNDGCPVNRIGTRFRTPPDPDSVQAVLLATTTCQYFWNYDDEVRGYRTYDSMQRLHPDLFLQTGDYVYYDRPGPLVDTADKARHKWHAMNGWPSLRDFMKQTPVYMIKDDHDLLKNDSWKGSDDLGSFTYKQGLRIWHENAILEDKPYRTFRWGKDLQIWLVEGREYRRQDENLTPAERTIWGQDQKEWFRQTVMESNATFKLLISPLPIVGPDRDRKADNHSNERFHVEGEWLRDFISRQPGMYIVNGDRHWQYASRDSETGVWEFGSGPVSDAHAGGWEQDDVRPEHRFLRVKGGFLTVKVDREKGLPVIRFAHHSVEGIPVNEERFTGDR